MRTRITKEKFGKNYLLAARINEKSLWLNPNKTDVRRKTLRDLWN